MPTPKLPQVLADRIFPVEDGCWLWTGTVNRYDYGGVQWEGKPYRIHRLIYELLIGPITEETLDHLCRQPSCVNPAHLEPVSLLENIRRGHAPPERNRLKIRCDHGHPLSGNNLYVTPDHRRQCRSCRRAADARYKVNKRKARI